MSWHINIKDEKEGLFLATSVGCGCCSETLSRSNAEDKIDLIALQVIIDDLQTELRKALDLRDVLKEMKQ